MNPKSITEYIQSLFNKIESHETMNIEYSDVIQTLEQMLGNSYESIKSLRERNEKLTTELTKAKEDIETFKTKKVLSLGNSVFSYCPW